METWQKIFIWPFLQGFLSHLKGCASLNALYMDYDKLHEHGLKRFWLLYMVFLLLRVNLTHPCSFIAHRMVLFFYFIYVDDMIITGFDHVVIQHIKRQLQASFHMKDLGDLHYFLGLEVCFNPKEFFSININILNIWFFLSGLTSATLVDTPLEVNVKYHRDEGDQLSNPLLYTGNW